MITQRVLFAFVFLASFKTFGEELVVPTEWFNSCRGAYVSTEIEQEVATENKFTIEEVDFDKLKSISGPFCRCFYTKIKNKNPTKDVHHNINKLSDKETEDFGVACETEAKKLVENFNRMPATNEKSGIKK